MADESYVCFNKTKVPSASAIHVWWSDVCNTLLHSSYASLYSTYQHGINCKRLHLRYIRSMWWYPSNVYNQKQRLLPSLASYLGNSLQTHLEGNLLITSSRDCLHAPKFRSNKRFVRYILGTRCTVVTYLLACIIVGREQHAVSSSERIRNLLYTICRLNHHEVSCGVVITYHIKPFLPVVCLSQIYCCPFLGASLQASK